jgi:hypothetical protein
MFDAIDGALEQEVACPAAPRRACPPPRVRAPLQSGAAAAGERGARRSPRAPRGARAGLRGRAAEVAGRHQVDVLIADTSGRLHTNVNLMKELEKVR